MILGFVSELEIGSQAHGFDMRGDAVSIDLLHACIVLSMVWLEVSARSWKVRHYK